MVALGVAALVAIMQEFLRNPVWPIPAEVAADQ
jgi:hypothetical protein